MWPETIECNRSSVQVDDNKSVRERSELEQLFHSTELRLSLGRYISLISVRKETWTDDFFPTLAIKNVAVPKLLDSFKR